MAGMGQMLMGAGPMITVDVAGGTASRSVQAPNSASVGYRISPSGQEQLDNGFGFTGTKLVVDPASSLSQYEVRLTVNAGDTLTGSSVGTWLSLGTTRTWSLSRSSTGTSYCNATIEIRRTGTTNTIDSATVSLTAAVTSGGGVGV